jgi:hypothetical protein
VLGFQVLGASYLYWIVPHRPAKSRETTPRSHTSHNALWQVTKLVELRKPIQQIRIFSETPNLRWS